VVPWLELSEQQLGRLEWKLDVRLGGSAATRSEWTGELVGSVNGRDGRAPCTREEERQ
jgi:hypothetical protein